MNSEVALALFIFLSVAVIIPVAFHFTGKLGPKIQCDRKNEPYESGIRRTIGTACGKFSIKYYLIAIVFVVFDIEVVFMYPWAVELGNLGVQGLVEMFIFMGILLLGLAYVYGKRILKWA